jgi:acetyl/propionyl-CoA carboxylase alpha subunit
MAYTFDAQKVIDDITDYSLRIAEEIGYDNVGTWEWIVTPKGEPFLMEVNTRIQVENGVSAAISAIKGQEGTNLIREQIRLGLGEKLGYTQDDVAFRGVSIEYRIIAEDTEMRFRPWTGRIERFSWKQRPGLQVHTQVPTDEPYQIPTEFDPNLALAIITGDDLEQAKANGLAFLEDLVLEGADSAGQPLKSNIAFLREKTANLLEF